MLAHDAQLQRSFVARFQRQHAQPPLPLEVRAAVRVLSLKPCDEGTLELRVVCQHGTYVKEWISGDEERTSPSLATLLGVGCRCAVLDVEEILTPDVSGPSLDG